MNMLTFKTSTIAILLVAVLTAPVFAASLEGGIMEAQQLLDAGDVEGAMEYLQELRVDFPSAGEPRFAIGCAWFMKGELQQERGEVEAALAAYDEARGLFDALLHDDNEAVAKASTFNRANCVLRQALLADPAQEYAGAVAALRHAIQVYENGLERFPEHVGMRQNLEHARYRLKQLLQQPPPEEDQQQEQEPSDEERPTLFSLFGRVETQLPGARTRHEDNTAVLIVPDSAGEAP